MPPPPVVQFTADYSLLFPIMAIATLNSAFTAMRGRVGDIVFKTYRTRGGNKIVLTRVPCFEGYMPSPAQVARRASPPCRSGVSRLAGALA